MTPQDGDLSRRDFIRGTATATLVGMTSTSAARGRDGAKVKPKTRVVLVRHADATDKRGKANAPVVQKMLDDGVKKLLDTADIGVAWRKLIRPSDVVGIKTNVWGRLPTGSAVEQGLMRRVLGAGVKEGDVAIDDRGVRNNPVFRRSTALINARPMRSHHWAGLGGCVKNYIMFVPKPPMYHGKFCSPLGAIWNGKQVAGKTRLNVLVMLTPLFHGVGPHHYDRRHTWRYNGLLLSKDPVAVDSIGREIIKAQRLAFFGEARPLTPPPRHIDAAEKEHKIGVADPDKIELAKLGWKDGLLI